MRRRESPMTVHTHTHTHTLIINLNKKRGDRNVTS